MTQGHSDEDIGSHYEDRARAAGLADLYTAATPLGEFYRDRMKRIGRLLEDTEGDLLDAGCGTGQMIRFLRKSRPNAFAFTGLDRSGALIDMARRVIADDGGVRFVVGRLEQMPLPDAGFDVVLAMGSLEYVADVTQALSEIARVTRPDGLAIVTMQNRWSPYRLWDTTVWSRMQRRRGGVASPIVTRLGERQLLGLLADVGLRPLSVLNFGYNVLPSPFDLRFPRLALGVQRRVERVARGPMRRLATDYIVAAKRDARASGPRMVTA